MSLMHVLVVSAPPVRIVVVGPGFDCIQSETSYFYSKELPTILAFVDFVCIRVSYRPVHVYRIVSVSVIDRCHQASSNVSH